MATFSLGNSGITPGAPGVYINERAGNIAFGTIAGFSTVYMLVETDANVPTTIFPFNTPIPVTSLRDYKVLNGGLIPDSGMPLLSYQCVDAFFLNAQVGDLRVVRVGTPNEIVEIEFSPSATKINATDLPSSLIAGNKVYVQMTINGIKLVAGDGSTGYTANGEWLGVPVVIPVSYVAGDEANNRKISAAITAAVATAIESNPAVSSSVFVRDFGQVNDIKPASNSENGFIQIAATTFDGNVSVVTQVLPQGSSFVFMQNAYDVNLIVGGAVDLERVPQDYTQCINTAFDGQQDQGYLITPCAYAQFDSAGRAAVGAAAALHCESNNFKWMALADPGPYLVTGINKYQNYTPHQPASDLVTDSLYLVDNVIYKWLGSNVTYNRLTTQSIVPGESAQTAVNESANIVADSQQVGLLDPAQYTVTAVGSAINGIFALDTDAYWPVTLPIQEVTLTGTGVGNDFTSVNIQGGASGVNLANTQVFVIAAPYDLVNDSEYSLNNILLATSAVDASNIYNAVVLAGGTVNITTPPNGAVFLPAPTGDTALLSYADSNWNLPVTINGQTSDLIENTSGAAAGVNTLHLPGTLQDPTQTYILNWVTRTLLNPSAQIAPYAGTVTTIPAGTATFTATNHGLRDAQAVYFTQPVTVTNVGVTTNLVSATTKLVSRPYIVKVLSSSTFVLALSVDNYSNNSFIALPTGTLSTTPSIFYSKVLGRGLEVITPMELLTLPVTRARKYAYDTSSIFSQAVNAAVAPGGIVTGIPSTSIYLNNSSVILGEDQITPYGEDLLSSTKCGWLPKFNLVTPTLTPVATVANAFCVPTVKQFFQAESFFVPAIDPILVGDYNGTAASGTIGPVTSVGTFAGTASPVSGIFGNIAVTGGTGTGLVLQVTVTAGAITAASVTNPGQGYTAADVVTLVSNSSVVFTGATAVVAINSANGSVAAVSAAGTYGAQLGLSIGDSGAQLNTMQSLLVGSYFNVVTAGTAPNGAAVAIGDRLVATYNGSTYSWAIVPSDTLGGDLTSAGQTCYGAQVELTYTPEITPPTTLWNFDAITSTEIIDNALRGVGFAGVPQAAFVEAGVDNVNRLLDDSQQYGNAFGFIAFYGPWIDSDPSTTSGVYLPPSPYVTGVAVRRYRAEGYQFPPAGTKYQLANAYSAQIPINSAQQNLLNPKGCNAVRTLPGYPQSAVYIWGGRTRLTNPDDAQQKLYQFVNTRVILNVVYGSLRRAFDNQIFNVIDGFGVIYNQIIAVGNSILNQLYVKGALYGAIPSDAFQVICDNRINRPETLEQGIVNAKVFVTPVPTLERIQIDLIRVAIGQMQNELDSQGLGADNS
jgi:hypothetical protein